MVLKPGSASLAASGASYSAWRSTYPESAANWTGSVFTPGATDPASIAISALSAPVAGADHGAASGSSAISAASLARE